MNLENLANLGDFISGMVVMISLVYLALQIRQNTRSRRTENFARGLDRISTMQSQLSQNPEFAVLHARGVANIEQLNAKERIQFVWWLLEAFGAFEFMFLEAKNEGMPEEIWQRWSTTIAWWLSYPGVRSWWYAKPTPFSKSFSAFVESCIKVKKQDTVAANRWKSFVQGPGRALNSQ